jgi:hypothetical protein
MMILRYFHTLFLNTTVFWSVRILIPQVAKWFHVEKYIRYSCTTIPLLVGRLWSSFKTSLRLSSKATMIHRGLFGLATNTCLSTANG